MAYTKTLKKKDVIGSQRMETYLINADGVSGTVATGMKVINSAFYSPISVNSGAKGIKVNTTDASAAANGTILVSGATNGDDFFITVYGV